MDMVLCCYHFKVKNRNFGNVLLAEIGIYQYIIPQKSTCGFTCGSVPVSAENNKSQEEEEEHFTATLRHTFHQPCQHGIFKPLSLNIRASCVAPGHLATKSIIL